MASASGKRARLNISFSPEGGQPAAVCRVGSPYRNLGAVSRCVRNSGQRVPDRGRLPDWTGPRGALERIQRRPAVAWSLLSPRPDENCTCHGGFNAQTWDDTVAGRTRPARGLQPRQRRAFRRRAEERPRARRPGAAIPGAAVRVADGGAVRNAVRCAAVQRDGALAVLRPAAAGLQPGAGVPRPGADDGAAQQLLVWHLLSGAGTTA